MNSMLVPGAWCPVSHEHVGLRTEREAVGERRPPVRHVHRVEAWLEQLVLEQHPDLIGKSVIGLAQCRAEAILAGPDFVLARVVRAVGEPQADGR
jgi:hypothetical protein